MTMNQREKFDWLSFAIQEALNGNLGELETALDLIETMREVEFNAGCDPTTENCLTNNKETENVR